MPDVEILAESATHSSTYDRRWAVVAGSHMSAVF